MSIQRTERPPGYDYLGILEKHCPIEKIFNGELIYPRQLEIHLPGDHEKPCNFKCNHCQGSLLKQPLELKESLVLKLIEDLRGRIPYHVYGGAYTEPLLNPWLQTLLCATKSTGSNYGIHTNGSLLSKLNLHNLCNISTPGDYVSVSIDAGFPESHMVTKNLKHNWFDRIVEGLVELSAARNHKEQPAIRLSYLINDRNKTEIEIMNIIEIANMVNADSLRFSIPYDLYGKDHQEVVKYKNRVEIPGHIECLKLLMPYFSNDSEKPFIFYIPPYYQDVERMDFKQCIYSYYQITLAADGKVYNCSSTASPSFPFSILGDMPKSLDEFNNLVLKSHNPDYNPSVCFAHGARCNRMALEVNTAWQRLIQS